MANEMRDRLVELLKKADENCDRKYIMDYEDAIVNIAEFLVANGVIVPVSIGEMIAEGFEKGLQDVNEDAKKFAKEMMAMALKEYEADDYCSYGERRCE